MTWRLIRSFDVLIKLQAVRPTNRGSITGSGNNILLSDLFRCIHINEFVGLRPLLGLRVRIPSGDMHVCLL